MSLKYTIPSGATDLIAMAPSLLSDGADLPLRFLSAPVKGGGNSRGSLRGATTTADQLALSLGALKQLLDGARAFEGRALQ